MTQTRPVLPFDAKHYLIMVCSVGIALLIATRTIAQPESDSPRSATNGNARSATESEPAGESDKSERVGSEKNARESEEGGKDNSDVRVMPADWQKQFR